MAAQKTSSLLLLTSFRKGEHGHVFSRPALIGKCKHFCRARDASRTLCPSDGRCLPTECAPGGCIRTRRDCQSTVLGLVSEGHVEDQCTRIFPSRDLKNFCIYLPHDEDCTSVHACRVRVQYQNTSVLKIPPYQRDRSYRGSRLVPGTPQYLTMKCCDN